MAKISVLMPTYNQAQYLGKALDSLLNQTYVDFELIVINDCSSDNTSEVLEEYAGLDSRISIIKNPRNLGIASSLNLGLGICKGTYIARMDSDDICFEERFAKQVEFLDAHPSIGVLGTQTIFINLDDEVSDQPAWIKPVSHNMIVWSLLFSTPICHPTCIIRKEILQRVGGYNPNYPNEDMELWARLAFITDFTYLGDTLLYYRMPYDVHLRKLSDWEVSIKRVSKEYTENILERAVDKDLIEIIFNNQHGNLKKLRYASSEKIFQSCTLLEELFQAMGKKGLFETENIESAKKILYTQIEQLVSTAIP